MIFIGILSIKGVYNNWKGATNMISAIIYTSTSGSCEYYAREMSRKLAIPCYEAKKCGLPKGMEVVFIGWLMNGKVTGLDAAMKDYDVKGVVQVGMGAPTEALEKVCRSKHGLGADVKVFSLQGRFDMNKIPVYFRPVMKMVNKSIVERLEGQSSLSDAEKATLQMAKTGKGEPATWDGIEEAIEWVKELREPLDVIKWHEPT